jgi:alpha-beta hydrolase superfamily lysophospholipase
MKVSVLLPSKATYRTSLTFITLTLLSLTFCGCDMLKDAHSFPVIGSFFPAPPKVEEKKKAAAPMQEPVAVAKPYPRLPAYAQLKDFPYQTLSLELEDGQHIEGRLYDAGQVKAQREAIMAQWKPSASAGTEEGEEEEAPVEEEPAEAEEGEAVPVAKAEAPKPAALTYPLLVLLHGLRGTGQRWESFAVACIKQGYAVWLPDLPGHGLSATQNEEAKAYYAFKEEDWKAIPQQMQAAWQAVLARKTSKLDDEACCQQLSPAKPVVVGVGLGASVALAWAGLAPKDVAAVAALAPMLKLKGIEPTLPLLDYAGPVYYAASATEPEALADTQKLHKVTLGAKQLHLYPDIGAGLEMLWNHPPAVADLLAWLKSVQAPTPISLGLWKQIEPLPMPKAKPAEVEEE